MEAKQTWRQTRHASSTHQLGGVRQQRVDMWQQDGGARREQLHRGSELGGPGQEVINPTDDGRQHRRQRRQPAEQLFEVREELVPVRHQHGQVVGQQLHRVEQGAEVRQQVRQLL
eukprot:SAG22_NODE_707_length_7758_cov_8.503199_2_plen_115_part_00